MTPLETGALGTGAPMSPAETLRIGHKGDFPIFQETAEDGRPLVYLDSAASAQKPLAVIEAMREFDSRQYANIHRGVYRLSETATMRYEEARGKAQRLLGAADPREIVFVRGTTEAVNLVAYSFVRQRLCPGDEILVTHLEHHANIVPWQILCGQTGASLKVAPVTDEGAVDLAAFTALLGPRTRLAAVAHVSNALGTVNPVKQMTDLAHARGVPILVDGAQAAPHLPVDVREIGCDFYAFSGHKLYGPTGIGVLYGKLEHLQDMPPYQSGGDMILKVSFEGTTFAPAPARFEAGTPHITGAVGLGAAIDYVQAIGMDRIAAHGRELLDYGQARLTAVPGLRLVGTAPQRAGLLSFVMTGIHPHDLGTYLAARNVAVRSGHHCAQPVMDRFGVPATTRASFGVYNTRDDLDALLDGLLGAKEFFGT